MIEITQPTAAGSTLMFQGQQQDNRARDTPRVREEVRAQESQAQRVPHDQGKILNQVMVPHIVAIPVVHLGLVDLDLECSFPLLAQQVATVAANTPEELREFESTKPGCTLCA